VVKDLKIIDSTTISLFSDILNGPGWPPLAGKKKGGIKLHTMINVLEGVPQLVRFSSAVQPDQSLLSELDLTKGSFVVFDKGYTYYNQFHSWSGQSHISNSTLAHHLKVKQIPVLIPLLKWPVQLNLVVTTSFHGF